MKYLKISSFEYLYVPQSNWDGTGSIYRFALNDDKENERIMLKRDIISTFIYMGVTWFVDYTWTIVSIEERDEILFIQR